MRAAMERLIATFALRDDPPLRHPGGNRGCSGASGLAFSEGFVEIGNHRSSSRGKGKHDGGGMAR
jgi:hypothetical protein